MADSARGGSRDGVRANRDPFVFVTSIALIVAAAACFIGVLGTGIALALYDQIAADAARLQVQNWPSRGGLGLLLAWYGIIAAIFLIVGIIGIGGAARPERAPRLLGCAIVLVVVHLCALIVDVEHGSSAAGEVVGVALAAVFLAATIRMRVRAGILPRTPSAR